MQFQALSIEACTWIAAGHAWSLEMQSTKESIACTETTITSHQVSRMVQAIRVTIATLQYQQKKSQSRSMQSQSRSKHQGIMPPSFPLTGWAELLCEADTQGWQKWRRLTYLESDASNTSNLPGSRNLQTTHPARHVTQRLV